MSIKAVIFDMDGTLLDTEKLISECMIEAAAEEGWTLDWDTVIDCIGTTAEETERILLKAMGKTFPYDRIRDQSIEKFKNIKNIREKIMKAGADRLMDCLDRMNIPFGLATTTDRSEVEAILDFIGIKARFRTIVCGDDVEKSKPDPEIYFKAAENMGIDSSEALVFEDSNMGINSAASAGARVVWVPDLQTVTEEVQKKCYSEIGSLDAVCDRLGELVG